MTVEMTFQMTMICRFNLSHVFVNSLGTWMLSHTKIHT
jgi:hypothetical protein